MLQKIRQPDTFAGAIAAIAIVLGYDNCAATVGKSEGLVRQWADPDQDALPNIHQALLLDQLFTTSTGQPGPIGALYAELTKAGVIEEEQSLPERLIGMHGEVSDVHNAVREAMAHTGEGGKKITKRERAAILIEIGEAVLALKALERDVKRVS